MIDEKNIEEAADKFAQLERIYFNEYYPMKNGFIGRHQLVQREPLA